LIFQSIFYAKHSTPRMSVEVEVLQSESRPNLFHFVSEAIYGPQARISGLVRIC
jgi:hypothetical protein